MATAVKCLAMYALLVLTIGSCRSTKCYEKSHDVNSCKERDLNNSIVDCPGYCQTKVSIPDEHSSELPPQILSCADSGNDKTGCVDKVDKQREGHFLTCVCSEDLCNVCSNVATSNGDISSVFLVFTILGRMCI